MARPIPRVSAVLVGLVLAAGACTGAGDEPAADEAGSNPVTGKVTVFAAASLTDALTELGDAFAAAHPDVDVVFNFAGSSELVAQITDGAPADVFASANLDNMATLEGAEALRSDPVVFTTTQLEIIVGPGNPSGVSGLADLADPDVIVIACVPEVPCGRYANEVLANAGVSVSFKSLEQNVKAVVSKVVLGEADAGIVYATDVIAAGTAAEGVEIPADVNVIAEYPIATLEAAPNPIAAQAFVEFVRSADARVILESYGFDSP